MFVLPLSVCNAKERSSFSFTVWDGKNENENELVKFVLVPVLFFLFMILFWKSPPKTL